MNLEINKDKLTQAILKAEKVTKKNGSLPVLSCVLLEAKNDSLIIKSTNLDIALELEIRAKVQEPGVVAVSGSLLSSYLNSLNKSDDTLTISLEQDNLYINSRSSETTLNIISPEDFPEVPKSLNNNNFTIKTNDLIDGFQSVWYSASTSNIKPELSSVYIYPNGEEIIFVATDSFRLAEKKLKIGNTEDFKPVLIPYRNAVEIVKILEDTASETDILFEDDQIILKNSQIYLVSRIVDGVFPDYNQIIPKESKTISNLLKDDFVQVMRTLNVFSDNFYHAQMSISPTDDVFEISTKNKDRGETINKIKAKSDGEGLKISFNFKYINDCLSSIKSDSLNFIFNGSDKPLIISGAKDGTFRYLVMPMNN